MVFQSGRLARDVRLCREKNRKNTLAYFAEPWRRKKMVYTTDTWRNGSLWL